MRVLGISGSLRSDSSNHALLRAIPQLAPDCTVVIYDGIAALPHFSPDRDVEPAPSEVARLRTLVREAEALVVSSPEYAHGMPGSLKNALDWLVSSGELEGKPLALLVASPSGGQYAQASLTPTLEVMGAALVAATAFTFTRKQIDDTGRLVDHAVAETLRTSLAALAASAAGAP